MIGTDITMIRLALCDFWPGFVYDDNFFVDFFRSITDVELVKPKDADVLIYSCFGGHHLTINNPGCKIFYTGENKRPNFNHCDFSITFDFDDYNGRNIRLPLWILYLDWFDKGGYNSPSFIIRPEELCNNRFIQTEKSKFCCMVNSHLANNRDTLIRQLSLYKTLGLYGAPWGTGFTGEETKYRIISNYKFNICFENDNFPGYHTEKLLQAKSAGCIPIYNGDKAVEKDFNPDCLLNLQDFGSISNLCEAIVKIDKDDALYAKIYSQPLFLNPPSLDEFTTQVRAKLKI